MFRDSAKSMLPLDSLSTRSGLSIFPSLINYYTFPDSDGQVIEKLTPISKCLGCYGDCSPPHVSQFPLHSGNCSKHLETLLGVLMPPTLYNRYTGASL